jgi:hypothetical protein
MAEIAEIAAAIAKASWGERIALIRMVPEQFGTARHSDVYAAIATLIYAPHLTPDFGYVHWRDEYELPFVETAYNEAYSATAGFTLVDVEALASTNPSRRPLKSP